MPTYDSTKIRGYNLKIDLQEQKLTVLQFSTLVLKVLKVSWHTCQVRHPQSTAALIKQPSGLPVPAPFTIKNAQVDIMRGPTCFHLFHTCLLFVVL